jgi:hypothetical protein
MDIQKLQNIVENAKDKSNKDLFEAEDFLFKQHEELKLYIVELTRKLEFIENLHETISAEIENRKV